MKKISIEELIKITAQITKVSGAKLTGSIVRKDITHARAIISKIAYESLKLTHEEIGMKLGGRNRTFSCKIITRWNEVFSKDKSLIEYYETILKSI